MIRAVLLLVLAITIPATACRAESPPAADRDAIVAVVSGQLDAFRADDWAAAWRHASPTIQRRCGSMDGFRAMVIAGYQAVYRPRSVRFGELRTVDGVPVLHVHVVGPDGKPAIAAYAMERQADGSWRIAGCVLLPATDRSV